MRGLIVAWGARGLLCAAPGRARRATTSGVSSGQRCDPITRTCRSGRGRCADWIRRRERRCEPMRRERGLRRKRHVPIPITVEVARSKPRRSLRDARSKLVAISRARRRQSDLCRVSLCRDARRDRRDQLRRRRDVRSDHHRYHRSRSRFDRRLVRARPPTSRRRARRRRFALTHDGGATWTTTPLDATVPSVNWGVAVTTAGTSVYVAVEVAGNIRVYSNASGGSGAFGQVDVTIATCYGDLVADPTTGTVWSPAIHPRCTYARAATAVPTFAAQVDPIGSSYNFSGLGGRGRGDLRRRLEHDDVYALAHERSNESDVVTASLPTAVPHGRAIAASADETVYIATPELLERDHALAVSERLSVRGGNRHRTGHRRRSGYHVGVRVYQRGRKLGRLGGRARLLGAEMIAEARRSSSRVRYRQ